MVRVRVRVGVVGVRVGVRAKHDEGAPPCLVSQVEAEGGDAVRLVRGRGRNRGRVTILSTVAAILAYLLSSLYELLRYAAPGC